MVDLVVDRLFNDRVSPLLAVVAEGMTERLTWC